MEKALHHIATINAMLDGPNAPRSNTEFLKSLTSIHELAEWAGEDGAITNEELHELLAATSKDAAQVALGSFCMTVMQVLTAQQQLTVGPRGRYRTVAEGL